MNWLAHLHLSEPNPAFRLGSLLPDLVTKAEMAALSADFQPGIARHLRIDAFTDSHPVFHRSISRLQSPYRRFGGILMDLFYDHFLASHWSAFSPVVLPEFATEVYAGFGPYLNTLPEPARLRLRAMQAENWLCSYRDAQGIAVALDRIGNRLRQPIALGEAVSVLKENYDSFYEDFSIFYPQIQSHLQQS